MNRAGLFRQSWFVVICLALGSTPVLAQDPMLVGKPEHVMRAIGKISDMPPARQAALMPTLIAALASRNKLIVETAAAEIGQLRTDVRAAVPHLMSVMRSARGRDGGLYSLILAQVGRPAVPALQRAVEGQDVLVRRRACDALRLMEHRLADSPRCDR